MPKTLFVLLAFCGLCATAFAQGGYPETDAPPARSRNAPPSAAQTPPPKRGVLQSLFGSRRGPRTLFPTTPAPRVAPSKIKPEPAETPKPRTQKGPLAKKKTASTTTAKKRKPKAKARVEEPEPAVAKNETPEPAEPPVEKPVVEKPAPVAPTKKSRKGKTTSAATATAPGEDPEAREKTAFDAAKAQAVQDPDVLALKAKADGAVTDDEARNAQRAYNKALFAKIREIDGSISERAKEMEAAILRRLEQK